MASRRSDDRRATTRFVESSDNAFIMAKNLEDIDFRRIATKLESFEKARRYLAQDLENYKHFRKHWETAIATFGRKFGQEPISDEDLMKVSILAYTLEDKSRSANKETQMYTILNEQSRQIGKSKESWKRFPYKGWYSILAHAVRELPTSPDHIVEGKEITCYRGVDKNFKYGESDSLVFNCFTSTTTDKNEALKFKSGGGILFQFDCIPQGSLGIEKYSMYGYEKEVLLAPWSTFKVSREVEVVKDENGSYAVIKLISERSEDEDDEEYEAFEEYEEYEDSELFEEDEDGDEEDENDEEDEDNE